MAKSGFCPWSSANCLGTTQDGGLKSGTVIEGKQASGAWMGEGGGGRVEEQDSGPAVAGGVGLGTHEQDRASWQRPQAGFRIRYMGQP